MNAILAKIGIFAIGLFIGGLVMKVTTDNSWKTQLANAKPNIVVQHDTLPPDTVTIIRRLSPGHLSSPKQPIQLTGNDSLFLSYGMRFLRFWANLGFGPDSAMMMQDSLTVERGFEIKNKAIGYLKVSYLPLEDYRLKIDEIRPPVITSDTIKTYPPIVQPKTFMDYLIQYAGYGLAFIFIIVALTN